MKLLHRRLIYLFFIGFFLMGLPLIFLYANGYKYNFKKHRAEKTGIIFLETKPSKVKVFLNGQLVGEKTPLRIKKLLPNTYELKIIQDGYKDWAKKIQINEGETRFIQYVRLFKANGEIKNLYNKQVFKMDYQPSVQLFLLQQNNNEEQRLILVNGKTKESREILISHEPIIKMSLIENGQTVLARTKHQVWLIDSRTGDKEELVNLLKIKNINSLKVNKYNSQYVYYVKDGRLLSYNRFNQQIIEWLDYEPQDYWIADNNLFYLAHNSLNKIFLNQLDLNTHQKKEIMLTINPAGDYQLQDVRNNYIIIQNKTNKNLVLFNQLTHKSVELKNVSYFSWDKKGRELLYGNQHEIWIFKPIEKEKFILLTRSAEKIERAIWYTVPTHIIYLVGNQIKIIENLNTNRQTVDLLKLKQINQLAIDPKADKIYFIGRVNSRQGLFELIIQDLND